MYFRFDCNFCGKSLKVRDENAGLKARCPYCHKQVTVPAANPETNHDHHQQAQSVDLAEGIDPDSIPVARSRQSGDAATGGNSGSQRHTQSTTSRRRGSRSHGSTSSSVRDDGTNVSLLVSAGIGAILSIIFLLCMWPLKSTYFGDLFLDRGWVPFFLVFLLFWSSAILFLKSSKSRKQRSSMLFDLLPTEIGEEINEDNVETFVDYVRSLPSESSRSFLINRVLRGLEHYRVRRSSSEVANMLSSQSDIDANAVDSSYTIVKVFIWAIPILGFIGTVLGISDAVGNFDSAINASDVTTAELTQSLSGITGGLSTAFDTTLVALVMSLIVMFPTSSMQKTEEDLLNWVDEYCNENLLKRLADAGPKARPLGEMGEGVRAAINDALAGNYGAMLRDIDSVAQRMNTMQNDQVTRYDQAITDLTDRAEQTQHEVANSMLQTAESMRRYFDKLEQGLGSLNAVLRQLGDKQIDVKQEKPKRGWRLFGKGK
jgi:biopolymer transport protein ExbB/TolQ